MSAGEDPGGRQVEQQDAVGWQLLARADRAGITVSPCVITVLLLRVTSDPAQTDLEGGGQEGEELAEGGLVQQVLVRVLPLGRLFAGVLHTEQEQRCEV